MRVHPATTLVLVLSASGLGAHDVLADTWRVDRHDAARTGASTGSVTLASPSVAWRAFLRGRPDGTNVRFGLGSPSTAVTSTGGRFVARDMVTQAVLWTSPILGSGSVIELADLDGDQETEVIVQTSQQAHVLDGSTGSLIWSSPPDEIQIMGAVHALDMDDDGLPDLYLDNGIGAKYGTTLASVFSFAGGTGHEVWSLPLTVSPLSVNAGEDALMDLDGDGVPEVVLASFDSVLVVNGNDGSTLATLTPPTPPPPNTSPYFEATALAAELDGQPGKEVLMVQHYWTTRGLTAYKLDVPTGQSQMLWSLDTGDTDSQIIANGDVPSDLDGDGKAEVIFSYRVGTAWTTSILNGSTGEVLASLPDSRFEGAAGLDAIPGSELIASTPDGLAIYSFASGVLSPIGSPLPGKRTMSLNDPSLHSVAFINRRVGVVAGPGNKPMLLAGIPLGAPGPFDRVVSFDSVQGFEVLPDGASFSLQQVGSHTPLVGSITGAMRADFATRPYAQVALGTSSGLVVVLNQHLTPTNGVMWFDGDPLGTFVGGALATRASLSASDSNGPFVVFPETFLGAMAADVRFASWILPPIPRWWRDNLVAPSIIDLDGLTTVVGIEDHAAVARHSTSGALVGSIELPLGQIRGTPLPIHVAGEPNNLVGIDWLVAGSHEVSQTKLDFGTQSIAWSSAPVQWAGFYGSSIGDLNDDGTDEWYTMEFGNLYRRDADSGTLSTIGVFPELAYSMPILAPFQGPTGEILLQNGWGSPWLVGADASPLWTTPGDGAPENGVSGARVLCNGVPRFVGPDLESPHLHTYDGPTGALVADKVYAGGHAYPTEQDAIAAGEHLGTMSNVNGVADLAGAPAALAGSTDGYLYAVDPCTLDVRWAADIGVSLDEPIVADVDGDGDDEILVAGTDGFVYGLDEPRFPAPFLSLDGDPGADLFEVGAGQSVVVSWQNVEGALQYEFALVGPDERAIGAPAYQTASGTSATLSLDGAVAGRPYRVSVRATGPAGAGAEALSKPIILRDVIAPTFTVSTVDGPTMTLELDASDDISLDHYELFVHAGNAATPADDGMLTSKHDARSIAWTAEQSLWGSDVTLEIRVFDSAGLHHRLTLAAHVGTDGSITTTRRVEYPGHPIGFAPPSGVERHPASSFQDGGCAVASSSTGRTWVCASLLLSVSLLRRRTRRGKRWA